MAEAPPSDAQSLAESWSLPKEATETVSPVEASHDENPKDATSEEVASDSVDAQLSIEKTDETTANNEDVTPEAADDGPTDDKINEATDDSPTDDKINELSLEENANEKSSTEEDSEVHEEEQQPEEVVEEKPVIKVETAPADFRFPTTNQTRHCFTRYVEYHRCVQAKGEGAPECDKFARYYRSLCPSEWVERWNEQRENGTFPGPL